MLKNEKYIGIYTYKDEVRIEGGVPAIIEPETFAKVQEMLKINKRAPAHTRKPNCEQFENNRAKTARRAFFR